MKSSKIFALAAVLAPLWFAGVSHADSEIKLQGRSTTSSIWFEIDDDNDSNINDSPRGGNGTTFGNVKRGESKERDFRIQNTGNETLFINSAVANSSQYEFVGLNLPIAIPANQDHEFQIRYTPLVFGTRTLRIVINNDEGANNSSERRYTFRVSGTGTGPDLTIFGGVNQDDAIANGAGIPAAGDSERRHFGNVQAGDLAIASRVFTLSNSGNDGLNLSNPRITGRDAAFFGYNGVNAGINLGDGNARSFTILFNPPVVGTYDATFSVDTNDERSGRGTYSFALRAVAVGEPLLRLEGKSGDFGSSFSQILDGDDSPRSGDGTDWGNRNTSSLVPLQDHEFRITNAGPDDLTVTSIETSNQIVFPLNLPDLPLTLAPDETATFFVAFAPAASQNYDATISIRSDSSIGSFFEFDVEGSGTGGFNGLGPIIQVRSVVGDPPEFMSLSDGQFETSEASGTRLAPTVVGASRMATFSIRNGGDENLLISASGSGSSNPEFQLTGLESSFNIASGTTHDFQVQFTPGQTGFRSSSIEIQSSDPNIGGIFNFVVGGFGTDPPAGAGPVALVLGGEDFKGKVPPGSDQPSEENGTLIGYNGTRVSEFAIFNDGDQELVISGFQFDGGDDQFRVFGLDDKLVVPSGGIHEFSVEYIGPSGQEIDALIAIETNDPDFGFYTFVVVSSQEDLGDPGQNSGLRISAINLEGFDVLLTVEASAGQRFRILASLDLENWVPLVGYDNLEGGLQRITNQVADVPGGQRVFYRAELDN